MISKGLMKLRLRDDISAEEEAALRGAISDIVEYPANRTIARHGEEVGHSMLMLEGLLARYKDLGDGQRQITHLHVAGDFPDLHSFTLKHLDHSLLTLTACKIAKVPHDRITAITEKFPHLTRVLWFSTNLDACIHREWEVSLGRRSALERTAHLLCEVQARMQVVGLADETGYTLGVTQAELSECLGLTSVHVNRVLRELRERGMCVFRKGRVTMTDLAALQTLAEFDPAYLYLEKRNR